MEDMEKSRQDPATLSDAFSFAPEVLAYCVCPFIFLFACSVPLVQSPLTKAGSRGWSARALCGLPGLAPSMVLPWPRASLDLQEGELGKRSPLLVRELIGQRSRVQSSQAWWRPGSA